MELRFTKYDLQFRHPFSIAAGTRNSTPVVYTALTHDGHTGYGEAALPPYLPETQDSVIAFLKKINTDWISHPLRIRETAEYINQISEGNFSAKAAVDMAVHDLYGKINRIPTHQLWAGEQMKMPLNSFTIGMDKPAVLADKLKEAKDFELLKVKLGGPYDNLIIKTLRSGTNKPICVDANQGWKDEQFALDMIGWLAEQGVVFVEQPLPKTEKKKMAWLRDKSPLPLIGDESVQVYEDLDEAAHLFHGINVKLMKCGGLSEAFRMIMKAKDLGLKILIGCMSESSCGVSAAAQLGHFADWTDLDGPLLITNDPFSGIGYKNGRIVLPAGPGNGVEKLPDLSLVF